MNHKGLVILEPLLLAQSFASLSKNTSKSASVYMLLCRQKRYITLLTNLFLIFSLFSIRQDKSIQISRKRQLEHFLCDSTGFMAFVGVSLDFTSW